jgi:hypothetical protein
MLANSTPNSQSSIQRQENCGRRLPQSSRPGLRDPHSGLRCAIMRTGLRVAALGVLFLAVVIWFFGGAHVGFSGTSVMITTVDPDTGQEMHSWRQQRVLGVDFIATAAGVAALLLGASWFFRNRSTPNQSYPAQTT